MIPGGLPSLTPVAGTHLRSVSALIPSRLEAAVIAAHSVAWSLACSQASRTASY